jgi:hypothetical protein
MANLTLPSDIRHAFHEALDEANDYWGKLNANQAYDAFVDLLDALGYEIRKKES